MNTVTVKRKGQGTRDAISQTKYVLEFSKLPDQHFGPWGFHETARDLTVSALMTATAARDAVMAAFAEGSVTRTIETW
jgi:hypothetical protein